MNNEQRVGIQMNSNGEILLTMYDDFSKDSCRRLMDSLIEVEQIVIETNNINKQLSEQAKQPLPIVRIKISSYGGSMYDAIAVINQIQLLQDSGVVFIGEANSYVASAGFMLLMTCDIRTSTGNQLFLLYHQPLVGFLHENIDRVMTDVLRTKQEFQFVKDMIIEKTRITKEELEKYDKEDLIMNLEEARDWGVINDLDVMKEYEEQQKKEQKESDHSQGLTDDEIEQLQEIFAELTLNEDIDDIEEEHAVVVPKPRQRRKRRIFKRRRK